MKPDWWWLAIPIVISACALVVSLTSRNVSRSAYLLSCMKEYLASYAEMARKHEFGPGKNENPLTEKCYRDAGFGQRARIQMTFGLLVIVVEAMEKVSRRRAREWTEHLADFEGVLLDEDFKAERCAITDKVRWTIQDAQLVCRAKAGPTLPAASPTPAA